LSFSFFLFFRRYYKIFAVLIFTFLFFFVYNNFLVDRSLVNLKLALAETYQINEAGDLQRIQSLLKLPLMEQITRRDVSAQDLVLLETANKAASSESYDKQASDIRFYLKTAIENQESKRGEFLKLLDKLNKRIYKPMSLPKEKLRAQARSLLNRIHSTKDTSLLQSAYYDLGNIYIQLSAYSQAEEAFLKAIELNSDTDIALKSRFNLAWVYKTIGQNDKALKYFEELSVQAKQKDMELLKSSEFQVADTFYRKGDFEKSRDKYAELAYDHNMDDTVLVALLEAGNTSLYKLDDLVAARKYYNDFYLCRLTGLPPQANKEKAEIIPGVRKSASELTNQLARSSYTSAVDLTDKRLSSFKVNSLRKKGFSLLRSKRYVEAEEFFRKVIEIAPKDARSYSGLSLALLWQEDKKAESLENAAQAYVLAPQDRIVLINTLFVYSHYHFASKAIEVGENALKPGQLPIEWPEFYYNLAYAYIINSNMDKAAINFVKSIALALDPDIKKAYNNLGCAYLLLKNYKMAIANLEEAVQEDPKYLNSIFNLGVAYYMIDDLANAKEQFSSVLKLNPAHEEAMDYLEKIIYLQSRYNL